MSVVPDGVLAPTEAYESLFARDIAHQLVRLDEATDNDYGRYVKIKVNGRTVEVPKAKPLQDAQGQIELDLEGRTTPCHSTVLDAILKLNSEGLPFDAQVLVPTLCHQGHMRPTAVCRLCVVQICRKQGETTKPERKLLPACQQPVEEGMEVFTSEATGAHGDKVRKTTRVLTELLVSEHLKPAPMLAMNTQLDDYNELRLLSHRLGINHPRFLHPGFANATTQSPDLDSEEPRREQDASSPVFIVDRSACILCGRCTRACNEIQGNNVIGRINKGVASAIGFDLDVEMGKSTCVQCGECMISCPTSSITFRPVGKVKTEVGGSSTEVSLPELLKEPLFDGIPAKFLLWQSNLVLRRPIKTAEVLCRQNDPGNSAFLMKKGDLQATLWPADPRTGIPDTSDPSAAIRKVCTPKRDFIVGEMACLAGTPRSADISALEDGEVWEIRRNVLYRLMRSAIPRGIFAGLYRERALDSCSLMTEMLGSVPRQEHQDCREFLSSRLMFLQVRPGLTIFREGDAADYLYLVRMGHVRVELARPGGGNSILFRGPGTIVGEIGLLAISPEMAPWSLEELDLHVAQKLGDSDSGTRAAVFPAGRRTATCAALDHLELARLDRGAFLEMLRRFPTVRRNVVKTALDRLNSQLVPRMSQFVEHGLFEAQNLLALDLARCTRCDACTQACVQGHGKTSHGHAVTRLLRDGVRFGEFLVATSCRSCKDPYCMTGCPVDAIHRGKHLQIVIEDHCIGCRLCEKNCPYGNIFMPATAQLIQMGDPYPSPQTSAKPRLKAATCDLCDAEGKETIPKPRCVSACPHDAAHRVSGSELQRLVESRDEFNNASASPGSTTLSTLLKLWRAP